MNRFFYQTRIKYSARLFLFLPLLWYSCSSDDKCKRQVDVSDISLVVEIEPLEKELAEIDDLPTLRSFLERHPVVAERFFKKSEYPNDTIWTQELLRRFQNPYIDTLFMETDRIFGNRSELKQEFADAFKHLKYYYPDFEVPKIKTVVTGLEHDLFISDSLIVLGLDWYLGEGAKFRPRGMYDYILRRYAKEYIVPSCMLLYGISPRYNKNDPKDKTILADAISFGKSFYFAKSMMPCTPDSLLIWYDAEEMAGVRENQKIIWAHLIENKVFYETSHLVKRKYIEDRPKTYEIGPKCPGRIATWVGWEIVEHYMENKSEVTFQGLMQNNNAGEIFKDSNYKPD